MPTKLINFYELKDVKKYMPQSKNPHFEETQIKIPSRVLCTGCTGAGKTHMLTNYLYLAQDTFIHIYVVYKMEEPLYEYLAEKLKGNITFFDDLSKLPRVNDLPYTKEGQVLLIFDDQVNEKDQKKIQEYFLRGRKQGQGISMWYLTQSYYAVPKFLRQQINYLIIIKIDSEADLKNVLRNYALGVDIKQLVHIFEDATKEFPCFLKIDLSTSDNNKRFSKDFDEFYKLKE